MTNELKTALISGASKGIGKAVALRLAALNYKLFLLGRDETALKSVVDQCQALTADVHFLCGDIKDTEYLTQAVDKARSSLGQVDVLVNNAGTAARQAVQEADLDAWQDVIDINLNAVMFLTRYLVPDMIARKSGAIVNISSISGRNTNAGGAVYCASKHALNGFTGCLYEDVRQYGLKVSAIMPGFVDTALTTELNLDANNMIKPDDIADAVEYILKSSPSCCPTEIVIRPQQRP